MYRNYRDKPKEPEINTQRVSRMDQWHTGEFKTMPVQPPAQHQFMTLEEGEVLDPAAITQQYQSLQFYNYMQYVNQMQKATGSAGNPLGLGFDIPPSIPVIPVPQVKIEGMPPGRPKPQISTSQATCAEMTYGDYKRMQLGNEVEVSEFIAARSHQRRFQSTDPRSDRVSQGRSNAAPAPVDDGWGDESSGVPQKFAPQKILKQDEDWDDILPSKPSKPKSVAAVDDDWEVTPLPIKKSAPVPARKIVKDDWDAVPASRPAKSKPGNDWDEEPAKPTLPKRSNDGWSDDEDSQPAKIQRSDSFGSGRGSHSNGYQSRPSYENRGGSSRGRGAGSRDGSRDRSSFNKSSGPRQVRDGDWPCTKCDFKTNFASRNECFRCKEPKGDAVGVNSSGGYQNRDSSRSSRGAGSYRGTGGYRGSRGGSGYGGSQSGSWHNNVDSKPVSSGWSDDESEKKPMKRANENDDWGSPAMKAKTVDDDDGWGTPTTKEKSAAKDKSTNDKDEWGESNSSTKIKTKAQNDDRSQSSSTPKADTKAPKADDDWGSTTKFDSKFKKTDSDDDWGTSKSQPAAKKQIKIEKREESSLKSQAVTIVYRDGIRVSPPILKTLKIEADDEWDMSEPKPVNQAQVQKNDGEEDNSAADDDLTQAVLKENILSADLPEKNCEKLQTFDVKELCTEAQQVVLSSEDQQVFLQSEDQQDVITCRSEQVVITSEDEQDVFKSKDSTDEIADIKDLKEIEKSVDLMSNVPIILPIETCDDSGAVEEQPIESGPWETVSNEIIVVDGDQDESKKEGEPLESVEIIAPNGTDDGWD